MADTVDWERIKEYVEDDEVLNKKIDQLADLVSRARYVVFFTGAGVSTSAGVPDYRGPNGAWTMKALGKKSNGKVDMLDAQPTPSHMTQATLIRLGLAHAVVTTNLDGLYRKAGLIAHKNLTCLHGDVYAERCTACGYEFERNWHVRQPGIDVHDHRVVTPCEKCGSGPKKEKGQYVIVGTRDKNCGTKDTHINFGEYLDPIDWDEAEMHCGKADLVIVAGTSMTLRHITHFPFLAQENSFGKPGTKKSEKGKVTIINMQKTPDDDKCDLRIFAKTDDVFLGLMQRLDIPLDPVPIWRPKDAKPISKIPTYCIRYYKEAAQRLEEVTKLREAEASQRASVAMSNLTITTPTTSTATVAATATATTPVQNETVQLIVGNAHQLVLPTDSSQNAHLWKVFVRQADNTTTLIDQVEFKLHPTFTPSSVVVRKAPFEVERLGWGTFDVGVHVKWLNGNTSILKHSLRFDKPTTEATVAVKIQ